VADRRESSSLSNLSHPNVYSIGVLKDEFVSDLLDLVLAYLPRSHSLQFVRSCSPVAALSVAAAVVS